MNEPAWATDPEQLERLFFRTVAAGDARGVDATLTQLALCDPARAQRLLGDLETALRIAGVAADRGEK